VVGPSKHAHAGMKYSKCMPRWSWIHCVVARRVASQVLIADSTTMNSLLSYRFNVFVLCLYMHVVHTLVDPRHEW